LSTKVDLSTTVDPSTTFTLSTTVDLSIRKAKQPINVDLSTNNVVMWTLLPRRHEIVTGNHSNNTVGHKGDLLGK